MNDRIKEIKARCEEGRPPRATDTRYLLAEIERLAAERDAAVKQMCLFCRSADKRAGVEPVCAPSCAWRGKE